VQHRNVSSSQFLVTQAVGAITGDMWFETQTVNIEGDFSYVAFDSTEIQLPHHKQYGNWSVFQ